MHLAAFKSDLELLELFLDEGAEVDAKNHGKITPLMVAAHHGFVEVVKFLINRNADVNAVDTFWQNALWYCFGGTERHVEVARILLEKDARLELNQMGKSLLIRACEKGNKATDLVSLLIANGADVNEAVTATGRTPLIEAARRGAAQSVKLLLEENASPDSVDVRGVTAAHESAYHGHVAVLQILAGYGSNLDVPAYNGNTPLHLAVSSQQLLAVRYLCQHGSNSNMKNNLGLTPKLLCKKYSLKAAAKEMKKAEKQYNSVKDKMHLLNAYEWIQSNKDKLQMSLVVNMTPDGLISREDALVACEILHIPMDPANVEKVFDVIDAQKTGKMSAKELLGDKYVPKPFTRATYEKEDPRGLKKGGKGAKKKKKPKKPKLKLPKEVKITISCGEEETHPKSFSDNPFVNVHIIPNDNLAYAKNDGRLPTPFSDDKVWILDNITLDVSHINSLCQSGDYDSIARACRNGINVNLCDACYKTPLMNAASAGHWDVVQLLLTYGANPCAVDNFGWSALHYACRNGHAEIVNELLQNGALVNAHTLSGASPLMKAIESNDVESVICCVTHGASLKAKTVCGLSVKDYARTFGDFAVYKAISRFLKAYKGGRNLTNDMAAVDPDTELFFGNRVSPNLYGKTTRELFRKKKDLLRESFVRQMQADQLPLRAVKPKAVKAVISPIPGSNSPENTVRFSRYTNMPLPPDRIPVSVIGKPLGAVVPATESQDKGQAGPTPAVMIGDNKEEKNEQSKLSMGSHDDGDAKPVVSHRNPFTDSQTPYLIHSSQDFIPPSTDENDPKLQAKIDQARKLFALAAKRFEVTIGEHCTNNAINPHDVFAMELTKYGRSGHSHALAKRTEMEKAAWAFKNHVDVQRGTDPVFYAPAPEDWYVPTRSEMAVRYHMQPGLFDRVIKANSEEDPLKKFARQAESLLLLADPKSKTATSQSMGQLSRTTGPKRFSVAQELQRIRKLHPQASEDQDQLPRMSLMHRYLGDRKQKAAKRSIANTLGTGPDLFKPNASPNGFS
ncbi:ankyrin repeat and EF-hand domain-containing protein 1-like isoform X2 [Paramacrobiotus metropolitanus]|nr:ankyrin repeat and EF-hand domain-containing protein 1-like isoform X2 [Paramacrobiotus metropolitanus]